MRCQHTACGVITILPRGRAQHFDLPCAAALCWCHGKQGGSRCLHSPLSHTEGRGISSHLARRRAAALRSKIPVSGAGPQVLGVEAQVSVTVFQRRVGGFQVGSWGHTPYDEYVRRISMTNFLRVHFAQFLHIKWHLASRSTELVGHIRRTIRRGKKFGRVFFCRGTPYIFVVDLVFFCRRPPIFLSQNLVFVCRRPISLLASIWSLRGFFYMDPRGELLKVETRRRARC